MTNNGAITLECPSCGRVFLTLQQGGPLEICPHCANAAPRQQYLVVPAPSPTNHNTTQLPQRRVEPVSPLPDAHPAQQPVFAPAPEMPPAQPMWQAPAFVPPPSQSAAQYYTPPPAPMAAAPAPLSFAPAPEIRPTAPYVPVPVEPPQPAPAAQAPTAPAPEPVAPSWPGLGIETPTPPTPEQAPRMVRMGTSKSAEPTAEPSPIDAIAEAYSATPKRRGGLVKLLVIGILAVVAWFVWQQPASVSVEAPVKESPAPEPKNKPPTPPPAAAEPSVEMRRAIPAAPPVIAPKPAPPPLVSTPDLQADVNILKALDSAATTEERLKVIADGSQHRASVEAFFKDIGGHLNFSRVEAGPRFTELSTGNELTICKVVTSKCPSGAMLRLRPSADGSLSIDWPLFVQTHSLLFDRFAPAASEEKSKRFILLMQRSRDFELPEEDRANFDSFIVQGSMSAAGSVRVYAARDSAAGRLLATRMAWGRTYVVEALLTHTEIGDKPVLAVLECKDGIGDSSK